MSKLGLLRSIRFNNLFGAIQRKRPRTGHRRARWRRKFPFGSHFSKRQSKRTMTFYTNPMNAWSTARLNCPTEPSLNVPFRWDFSLVWNPTAILYLISFFLFLISHYHQLTHWLIQDKYRRKLPPKPKPRQFKSRNYHVSRQSPRSPESKR